MARRKTEASTAVAVAPSSPSSPGGAHAFPNGMGKTVSGELNYLVRRMMEQGGDGIEATPDNWPKARLDGESVSAEVIFTPSAQSPHPVVPEDQADQYRRRMWYLVRNMDDLTADCWDALISHWVAEAASPEAKVWVSVDQILAYRGLASHLTGSNRGGFTSEQRMAVTESLLRIISMRLQVLTAAMLAEQVDEQGKRRLLPVKRQIGGPALEVGLDLSQTDFLGRTEIKAIFVKPGEMLAHYYMGAGRPVALLSQKALTYQPYREIWEKRLTRYFAYAWDRCSNRGVARQQHAVKELLEAVHQQVHPTRPDDTKARMEKALRRLTDDGVIASWDYVSETWDEDARPRRYWLSKWLEAHIEVAAPEQVRAFYELALPAVSAGVSLAPLLPNLADGRLTGEAIAAIRNYFGLSQEMFAQELGISRALVNLIENGKRSISKKVQTAIARWLSNKVPGRSVSSSNSAV